jgi:hypothetical protein
MDSDVCTAVCVSCIIWALDCIDSCGDVVVTCAGVADDLCSTGLEVGRIVGVDAGIDDISSPFTSFVSPGDLSSGRTSSPLLCLEVGLKSCFSNLALTIASKLDIAGSRVRPGPFRALADSMLRMCFKAPRILKYHTVTHTETVHGSKEEDFAKLRRL